MENQTERYEKGHIKRLQDERIKIQKKTFTKWMNSHLNKVNMNVNDLFTDLADGKYLIKLMEVISGEPLGKPNLGRLRVQKIENVNRALHFIQSKVILENIGAEDIVDGNQRLILGLIWTIILRFEIQSITYEPEEESGEKRSAKDALLLWCQRRTKNYRGVNVKDFSGSWRDGLAFNALIHAHRPDAIDFEHLNPQERLKNLHNAFNAAHEHLGVPILLDAEDVDVDRPDDKVIMTYVSSLYHTFAKMKSETTGAKRVGNLVSSAMEYDKMVSDYELNVRQLLDWIRKKTTELKDRNFPNSLELMQKEMAAFKQYRTVEKPVKFKERSDIDALLFQLSIKQKQHGFRKYCPAEGLLLKDIETAWNNLEKAEHSRELAIRSELLRLERLQREADKFMTKAKLRKYWLMEMTKILTSTKLGTESSQLETAIKRHQSVSAEIMAKAQRFKDLNTMADNLVEQKYENSDKISEFNRRIQKEWKELQQLLAQRQESNTIGAELLDILRALESIEQELQALHPSVHSTEFGNHLLAAEDLLERHTLCERQLKAIEDRYKQIQRRSKNLTEKFHQREGEDSTEVMILTKRLVHVGQALDQLMKYADGRRRQLVENCMYMRLLQDMQDEDVWLQEKQKLMESKDVGQDMPSLLRLLRRHKLQEQEIQAHTSVFTDLCEKVRELQNSDHFAAPQLQKRTAELKEAWNRLHETCARRKALLRDAQESQQYYADAREAEQWMLDRQSLLCTKDYGKDEGQARAMLKRHQTLHLEIENFGKVDLKLLKDQTILMTQSADKHQINPEKLQRDKRRHQQDKVSNLETSQSGAAVESLDEGESGVEYDTDDEDRTTESDPSTGTYREVTVEEEVEEMVVKNVVRDEPETVEVHQGRLLHSYAARDPSGRDISGEKDDMLVIVNKVSGDWWLVENSRTKDRGYMPANHIRDMGIQRVQRTVRRTVQEKVPTMVKRMVTKRVPVSQVTGAPAIKTDKRQATGKGARKIGPIRRATSVRKADNLHFDKESIEKRQKELEYLYDSLLAFGAERERHLRDAEHLFKFEKECRQFESWMIDKEKDFSGRNSLSTDVEAVKKRYTELINEMALNASRLRVIHELRDELLSSNPQLEPPLQQYLSETVKRLPSPVDKAAVKKRCDDIDERWNKLNEVKSSKEKALKDVSGIERFNKAAVELKTWITDKLDELKEVKNDVGRDKKSNEALLRRHQNLENEIHHMKEKVDTLHYLGDGVKSTYPDESAYVDGKVKEVDDLWSKLLATSAVRKSLLNSAGQRQNLQNQATDLALELGSLLEAASRKDFPRDLSSTKEALSQHADLKDDIESAEMRLNTLSALADNLKKLCPSDEAGKKLMDDLNQTLALTQAAWMARQKQLKDMERVQKFLQECDQIDLISAQQMRLLDLKEEPVSVEDVIRSQKQHTNFMAMVNRQDVRVAKLTDSLDKLSKDLENVDSKAKLQNRVGEVVAHRDLVKSKAAQRSKELDSTHKYLEFKEAANELEEWLKEKHIAVAQEDHKDLAHIADKLKKHEALFTELKAHEHELAHVEKLGRGLLADPNFELNPHQRADVTDHIEQLHKMWEDLLSKSAEKSERLKHAEQVKALHDDANVCGDGIEQLLRNLGAEETEQPFPGDLLQAKEALRRHGKLLDALSEEKARLLQLEERKGDMLQHGDVEQKVLSAALQNIIDKLKGADPLLAARLETLKRALNYHQFLFDISEQMERIRSMRSVAASEDYGHTLAEVASLLNRHKNLTVEMGNMEPQINTLLHNKAPELQQALQAGIADDKNRKAVADSLKNLESKCNQLERSWHELKQLMSQRQNQLRDHAAAFQMLADVVDLKESLQEKAQWLDRVFAYEPRDKNAVDKVHHKVKSLETDLKHPGELIADIEKSRLPTLRETATDDQTLSEDMLDTLQLRVSELRETFEGLQQRSKSCHNLLHQYVKGFEYVYDAEDLEVWMTDTLQKASSTECGDDMDHLSSIVNHWSDLKASVEAGEARYKACDETATALLTPQTRKALKSSSPSDQSQQHPMHNVIASQQQRLRDDWRLLQQQIESRERDLATAREVHEFNQDMSDCHGRINEKLASLISKRQALEGDEGSMNRATLKAHSHAHELFQKELAILEQQVLDLQDDGGRLMKVYPGRNAAAVKSQLTSLQNIWMALQAKSDEWYKYLVDASLYLGFQEETRRQKEWLWDASNEAEGIRNVLHSGQSSLSASPTSTNSSAHLHECENRLGILLQELSGRDKEFSALVNKGESMVENNHFAQREIQDVLDQLLDNKNELHRSLNQTSIAVKEAILVQQWLKDWQPLNSIIVQKQAQLHTATLGSDLQEVEIAMRKHTEREAMLKELVPKIESLTREAQVVIQKAPNSAPLVKERVDTIHKHLEQLKQSQQEHGKLLQINQLYLNFLAKAADFRMWLREKEGQLLSLSGEANTLEQKIHLLQKYQAFEVEVLANEEQVTSLQKMAVELIEVHKHSQGENIFTQMSIIQAQWKRLKEEMQKRGALFEGAKDLLAFHSEVDHIDSWIRAKSILCASHDLGKDLEHCQSIRQNLQAPEDGKTVNDSRISQLKTLLSHLPQSDPHSIQTAQSAYKDVVDRYKKICSALSTYDTELEVAEKIHAFHREVQDLSIWMEEKMRLASSQERGHDVPSVNNLLRSQGRLERELTAIKTKLQDLHLKKDSLVTNPENERLFNSLGSGDLSAVDGLYEKLEEQVKKRQFGLQRSLGYHTYVQDSNQLLTWADRREEDMKAMEKCIVTLEGELQQDLTDQVPLSTVSDVRSRLDDHQQNGFYDVYKWSPSERDRLLGNAKQWLHVLATQEFPKEDWMTPAGENVQKMADKLPTKVNELQAFWTRLEQRLKQLLSVKEFIYRCQSHKEWIISQELELARSMETLRTRPSKAHKGQDELKGSQNGIKSSGDNQDDEMASLSSSTPSESDDDSYLQADPLPTLSLTQVESVLRKVDTSILPAMKSRKIQMVDEELTNILTTLKHSENPSAAYADSTLKMLSDYMIEAIDRCERQRQLLQEEVSILRTQKTLRTHIAWCKQRIRLAGEATWSDGLNLESKLAKWEAQNQEILNHLSVVQTIFEECNILPKGLDEGQTQSRLESLTNELKDDMETLRSLSALKLRRLKEAQQWKLWYHQYSTLLRWAEKVIDPVMSQTTHIQLSEVNAVKMALKKHKTLQENLEGKCEQLEKWNTQGDEMCSAGHYQKEEIRNLMDMQKSRFEVYSSEMRVIDMQLQAVLQVCQFYQDCREELQWINDRMNLATNKELPASLYDLHRLHKRHLQLLSELSSHENIIQELRTQQKTLLEETPSLVDEQKQRVHHEFDMLFASHKTLKKAAKDRDERLTQAIYLQTLMEELHEVDAWSQEQTVTITSFSSQRKVNISSKGVNKSNVLSVENDAQSDMKRLDTIEMDMRSSVDKKLTSIQERIDNISNPRDSATASEKLKLVTQHVNELGEFLKQERKNILIDLKYFSFAYESLELLEWMERESERLDVEEYGEDLEKCQLLNVEFEETAKIISNQGNKVSECISKGNKLIESNSIWSSFVKETNQNLNTAWAHLRNATKTCKEALSSALLVHKYDADCDDLIGLIRDKLEDIPDLDEKQFDIARRRVENLGAGGFTKLDYILQASARAGLIDKNRGETLRECTARHEALQREMIVLEKQKTRLEKEALRLSNLYGSAADHINGRLQEVIIAWNTLGEKSRSRRDELKESLRVQLWLEECNDLLAWIRRQQALITEVKKLPTDLKGAESLLQKNHQHGQDVQSREGVYHALLKSGESLRKELAEFSALLEDKMMTMTRAWDTLQKTWKLRKDVYEENLDLRRFLHEGSNLEQWLVEHEQQLQAGQTAASLSAMTVLDAAIAEHTSLMQKVKSVEARFEALKRLTLLERHLQGPSGDEEKDDLVSPEKLRDIKRMATKLAIQERARQGSVLTHSQTVRGTQPVADNARSPADVARAPSKAEVLESPVKSDKANESLDIRKPSLKAKFSMRSQPPSPKGPTGTPGKEEPSEFTTVPAGSDTPSLQRALPPLPGRVSVAKTNGAASTSIPMMRINVDNVLDEESSSSTSSSSDSEAKTPPSAIKGARTVPPAINITDSPTGRVIITPITAPRKFPPLTKSLTSTTNTTHKQVSSSITNRPAAGAGTKSSTTIVTTTSNSNASQNLQHDKVVHPSASNIASTRMEVSRSPQTPILSRPNVKALIRDERPKMDTSTGDSPPVTPQNISISFAGQSSKNKSSPKGTEPLHLDGRTRPKGADYADHPPSPIMMNQPSSPGGRPTSTISGSVRGTATLRPGGESPTFNVSSTMSGAASSRPQSSTLPPDYRHDKKPKKESHGISRLVPKFMKSKSRKEDDV